MFRETLIRHNFFSFSRNSNISHWCWCYSWGTLIAAGGSFVTAGKITLVGGIIHERVAKKKQLEGSSNHLRADYFNFIQLKILIGRAASDENFANKCNIPIHEPETALDALGEIVKVADNIINIASSNISGGATGTAFTIPIDVFQLNESSNKLHQEDQSAVVKYIEKLADALENELWLLLKYKGYTLVKIQRHDKENRKHCLLLAVEENSLHEVSENVNVSLEDIYANHVVIADCSGKEIDPLLHKKLLAKWEGEGGNKKKKGRNEDDERGNKWFQDGNEEDEKENDEDNKRNEDDEVRNEENEEEKKGSRVGNQDEKEEDKAGNEEPEEEKEENTIGNKADEE